MFKKIVAISTALLMLVANRPAASAALVNTGMLAGESALFIGDSVAAGWRDTAYGHQKYTNGGGWSLRFEHEYGMSVTNVAKAGTSLTVIPNRGHIIDQLHNNKSSSFDYIIMEGGANDCMGENTIGHTNLSSIPKLGTVSSSFNVKDFDTSTFSGAFEELLYYATNYWPQAKIGFIVMYKAPNATYGGMSNGAVTSLEGYTQEDYYNRQMELCLKWGVPYFNMWSGTTADGKRYSGDIIDVYGSSHFPGGRDMIHLTAAGYDAITPHIAQWMAGMSAPETRTTTTTTATTTTTTTASTTATTTKPSTTATTKTTTATRKTTTTTATATTTTMTGATTATTTGEPTIITAPTRDTVAEAPQKTGAPVALILGIAIGAMLLVIGGVVATLIYLRKKGT